MEIKKKYKDLEEREIIIKEQEALGFEMLHDDFDKDWKHGQEPRGTMTFTNVHSPSPPSSDWQAQWKAAANTNDKLAIIAKRLGLE